METSIHSAEEKRDTSKDTSMPHVGNNAHNLQPMPQLKLSIDTKRISEEQKGFMSRMHDRMVVEVEKTKGCPICHSPYLAVKSINKPSGDVDILIWCPSCKNEIRQWTHHKA
jgi:hypothetical protein